MRKTLSSLCALGDAADEVDHKIRAAAATHSQVLDKSMPEMRATALQELGAATAADPLADYENALADRERVERLQVAP